MERKIGIVGHAADKFTYETEAKAREIISDIIDRYHYEHGLSITIVSGHCPIGGIDIWAEEAALDHDCDTLIFPPKVNSWERGYKQRNIQIAEASDEVHNIVVATLPPGRKADPWNRAPCYHCIRRPLAALTMQPSNTPHIKSGGCWTTWYAIEKFNKLGVWHVISS